MSKSLEKEGKEVRVSSHLTTESVKVIAESVGTAGLPEDASTQLADDCTYRLKQIVQVICLFVYLFLIFFFFFK